MADSNIDITVIIPFLNEQDNINELVSSLNRFYEKSSLTYEIIFVNDGSEDDSLKLLCSNKNQLAFRCNVVNLSKTYGSHAALRAGILHASGKYIVFLYADLQDPIELIDKMYSKIISGNKNMIWATRKVANNSVFETFFSKTYSRLMKKYVSPLYPANGFDIVMFDRKIQKQLNRNIESNSSVFLQILTMGFKQDSIEYEKLERKLGESKWTLSKKIKLLIDSFVAFSYFPIRLLSITGIIFFLTGLLWTGYIIFRKIYINDLDSGWPALISILMIGFGITNIGIGIVAEYLWRTLDASRNRPVFIIDDIIELNKE